MELIHTVDWMRQSAHQAREQGGIVGLVPTGGGLHAGHLSLAGAARRECSPVIVSIFSDPNNGDGEQPHDHRSLEADCAALESLSVDYLFAPSARELYPPGFSTRVVVEGMAGRIEDRSLRAATTALKLCTITQPAFVYVGRKHAKQACIFRRMARDLNLDTEIVVCPIVREPDGLAVASRNARLKADERRAASVLHRALAAAQDRIERGESLTEPLAEQMRSLLVAEPLATVDHVKIVDADTFQPVPRLRGACLALATAFIGSTRLSDNMLIEEREGRFTCTI